MVEMQVAPIENDVLFYGDTSETIIPPGEEKDVWVVLLTEGTPHSVRDLYVTYYLWGHPQEVKFTYDEARYNPAARRAAAALRLCGRSACSGA